MQTHDHTIFCDDFIVERQIDEYEESYPEIANMEKAVVRSSGSRIWRAFRFTLWMCFAPCAFVVRSLLRIAKAIQWASKPRQGNVPKEVYPGLMVEFVVFGLFVVCAGMSIVL